MKNLAELKRTLKIGDKIKTLGNSHGKWIGDISVITKIQSNGFYIDREGENSWLEYPKASQVYFESANVFLFELGYFFAKYEIVL